MIEAVITVCLIYMALLVVSFAVKLARSDREGRLHLVKGYAKGRFVLIYAAAIPMFIVAMLYDGANVIESIFGAVEASVNLVVLKLDYGVIATLLEDSLYFYVVMVILFALCVINAAMLTLALFYQKGVNWLYKKRATRKAETTYVVVGVNPKNREILTSCEGAKIWITEDGKKDTELEEFAYLNGVALQKIKDDSLGATLKHLFADFTARSIKVIINTACDETNLLYAEEVSELICGIDHGTLDIEDPRGLHVYVFGEPENGSAFLHFVKKTSGQVRYVNKYKLIALDFVDKHPLTEYMGENEIDYGSATLKDNVDLNVVMVGYNKTMQEILVTSVANNQFTSLNEDGTLVERAVRYSVFTGNAAKGSDKNLNHSFLRYSVEREEMLRESDKYLPLPSLPALVNLIPEGINDLSFYKSVKDALSAREEGRSSFNQIIVSYGTDIENIDIAEKLSVKIKEWGLDSSTRIFVKVRSAALAEKIVKEEYKDICELHTFATENEVVYNLKRIISENIETMARDRHLAYAVCDALQDGKDERETKVAALKKWYSWAQPQRDSNVYGVLSIRMKLHLMGYDYESGKGEEAINKAFMDKYASGDPIKYKSGVVGGKKLIHYDNGFVRGSLRERMAIHEHQRWNAYMITQGIIPSSKDEIMREGGKNLALRRHGCLTTFEGLLEYRRIMALRNGTTEENEDVIRYDYQLFDDLIWLLERNGNRLVKR